MIDYWLFVFVTDYLILQYILLIMCEAVYDFLNNIQLEEKYRLEG